LSSLLIDPRVSTDAFQHWPPMMEGRLPPEWPLHVWVSVRNMFTAQGPDHRRLRSLVSSAFTARRVEQLRPFVVRRTAALLDGLETQPHDQPVDLRGHFAYPLPLDVICHLFGVPEPMRPDLRRVVSAVFDTSTAPTAQSAAELAGLLAGLVASKRAEPADDLTSALIAARDADDGRLDDPELIGTLLLMLGGGHETTANLIDHAVVGLLDDPVQRDLAVSGQVSWQDVVEEALRWQAPVANLRYAIEDIETGEGCVIRQGEAILASYAGACRDPQAVRRHRGHVRRDAARATASGVRARRALLPRCVAGQVGGLDRAGRAVRAFPNIALAVRSASLEPLPSFISNGHRAVPVLLGLSTTSR
jgi:cytochrome P450